ncbi:MAG: hypothetical protein ACI8YQ_001695 [Polaribacter sp.]|jgi:hypothetical protein
MNPNAVSLRITGIEFTVGVAVALEIACEVKTFPCISSRYPTDSKLTSLILHFLL